jgi:hypothetical protein
VNRTKFKGPPKKYIGEKEKQSSRLAMIEIVSRSPKVGTIPGEKDAGGAKQA